MKSHILTVLMLSSSLLTIEALAEELVQRPNILFIAADDMNNDLGVYGHQQVKTPHLQRMADQGVRFERAYCQQPLCGPSRASVMTGMRPSTTGFVSNRDQLRKLVPDVQTMGEFFQAQGYYVARVGKIYHYGNPSQIGTNGADDSQTWMEVFNPAGIDRKQEKNIISYPGGIPGGRKSLGISMAWWDPVSEDNDHTDGLVAQQAIDLMSAEREEPFFLAVGFFNPHCPYVAPKRYFDLYDRDAITMQTLEEAKADLDDVPAMAVQRDMRNWPYYFKDVTLEEARTCKWAYYACQSFVDAQIGRLLDALESQGILDNTIVVFWSDHGYFLGEKGLWYKRKNFERALRVPLLMQGPGIAQGGVQNSLVELLDLYPTLVDLAGFEVPGQLEGKSMRGLVSDPSTVWEKPALSQVFHHNNAQGYSIRTDRWRFIKWIAADGLAAGIELYDHQSDPDEVTNLAYDPAYDKTVTQLSEQLEPHLATYKNIPEKPGPPQKKRKK